MHEKDDVKQTDYHNGNLLDIGGDDILRFFLAFGRILTF